MKCWGANGSGQLGNKDSSTNATPTPVAVSEISGARSVSAGNNNTCAVVDNGIGGTGAKCWGYNLHGEVGSGAASVTPVLTPTWVSGMERGVTAVSTGYNHSCGLLIAIATTSRVRCWGFNSSGQLGNNQIVDSASAVDVDGLLSGVSELSVGGYHSCATLAADRTIVCWGSNQMGQGGLPTFPVGASLKPAAITSIINGASRPSAGFQHTCAFQNNFLKCWGAGSSGQLGTGSMVGNSEPTAVVAPLWNL